MLDEEDGNINTCVLMGELLKEKQSELEILEAADVPDEDAIHNLQLEVDALDSVYLDCDTDDEVQATT